MSNTYQHIIPNLADWPITKFSNDKEAFINRLNEYTFNRITKQQNLEVNDVLEKTIFLELKRTSKNKWKVDPSDENAYWKKLRKEVTDASNEDNKEELLASILKRIINRYSVEIVGNFQPKTFKFARKFLTFLFKRIFNPVRHFRIKNRFGTKNQLLSKFKVSGEVEQIRNLYQKGTVVVLPTHYSNLDSILIGYVIDAIVGIPAFIYGAGLNLYNNEIVGYYMNRMGTYRVDRRKKNRVYIETLKSMNTLSLIEGVNNLFFPGGTRSRSGSIESQVKLGLLNSVVESQRYCINNKIDQKIFIIPLVTSSPFILDANNLIHDYLKGFGKEKYNGARKKYGLPRLIIHFFRKSRAISATTSLHFGEPMDVFGNRLNIDGESVDENNNIIDISQYFMGVGEVNTSVQREYIYTKKLGSKVLEAFQKSKVVIPSSILAFAAFRLVLLLNNEKDIFNIFKYPNKQINIPRVVLEAACQTVLEKLVNLQSKRQLILSDELINFEGDLVDLGIKQLGVYHIDLPLISINSGNFGTESLKNLFYYHNQLVGYNLEDWFDTNFSLVEQIK